MSIDVRTGGRLHPVGVMMKRKAVNVTRRQEERLQNQRPHPPVKIEDEEGAHEVDTGSGCSGGCDCWQGSDCRNNAHTVMSILNTIQKNILSHKFRIRMKRQVLSKKCA